MVEAVHAGNGTTPGGVEGDGELADCPVGFGGEGEASQDRRRCCSRVSGGRSSALGSPHRVVVALATAFDSPDDVLIASIGDESVSGSELVEAIK